MFPINKITFGTRNGNSMSIRINNMSYYTLFQLLCDNYENDDDLFEKLNELGLDDLYLEDVEKIRHFYNIIKNRSYHIFNRESYCSGDYNNIFKYYFSRHDINPFYSQDDEVRGSRDVNLYGFFINCLLTENYDLVMFFKNEFNTPQNVLNDLFLHIYEEEDNYDLIRFICENFNIPKDIIMEAVLDYGIYAHSQNEARQLCSYFIDEHKITIDDFPEDVINEIRENDDTDMARFYNLLLEGE